MDANEQEDSSDSEHDEEQLEEEESSTSEENESESDDADDSAEEAGDKNVPFHEHPRFTGLVNDNKDLKLSNKELKSELEALRKEREEAQRLAGMSPQEKAQHEAIKKLNLATKTDVEAVKKQNAMLKDQLEFEKFLAKTPDASEHAKAIKAIAYSKDYAKKSYADIYSEFYGSGKKKVVARKVKTGIKARSGGKGNAGRFFTREDIKKMSKDEFAKNEKVIMKQMADGRIK